MENPTEENQLNIELPEEMAEGHYVNLALIAHSPSEFVMDFIRILPGDKVLVEVTPYDLTRGRITYRFK